MGGNTYSLRFNPLYVIILFIVFVFITHFYSIFELEKQKIIGLDLSYDYETQSLVLDSVKDIKSEKIIGLSDLRLLNISDGTKVVPLTKNMTIWPLESKNNKELRSYLAEHKSVYDVLQSGVVIFNKGLSNEFQVEVKRAVSVKDFPMEFWLIRLCNTLALLVCVFVWIYKPSTSESYYMISAGVSYYLFGLMYSISSSSEFTLDPSVLSFNVKLQIVFLGLFALSFLLLLMQYPAKILPKKSRIVILMIFSIIILSNLGVLADVPFHKFFFQFLFLFVVSVVIAFYQWRVNKYNPINKAATIALQLSLLIPAWIIKMLYFLPIMYGEIPILNHFISHLLLSLIFVGWAVAILKFHLFEVERWWFKSWLWIVSSFLIIAMDLILVYLFNWGRELTTALNVIIVGFLYFPVRQYVFSKTLKLSEPILQDSVVDYFERSGESNNLREYDDKWLELLNDNFDAVSCKEETAFLKEEKIENSGLYLYVRSLRDGVSYKLSGKQQGNRLFNNKDVDYSKGVFKAVQAIAQSNISKEEVRLQERKRVMHDLHDNLGALLLTMTHNSDSELGREQAGNALKLLRDTVYFSSANQDIYCIDLMERCRTELTERLINKKTKNVWRSSIPDDRKITSEKSLAIAYIFREAFTNAIKHADPKNIEVDFLVENNTINIKVTNDTEFTTDWKAGVGINSIKRRCKSVMGRCDWNYSDGEVSLEVTVPL